MDILSLLTGSENLYKYSFIGGLALIIISLFYPLEKRYELACQKDLCNKEVRLTNIDIDYLNREVKKLNDNFDIYNHELDTVKSPKSKNLIKDEANKKYEDILLKRKQLSVKEVEVAYRKDMIATLSSSILEYRQYEHCFWWFGGVFTIFGFVGWFILMLKKHCETAPPNP